MIPFLSLKDVTALHGEEINAAVTRVVNSGWYLQGEKNETFEKNYAQFIVNTDGSVSDLELTEHLEAACDREVLRVLRMMPNWQAGVMNAKPCRTKVCIPVVFNM